MSRVRSLPGGDVLNNRQAGCRPCDCGLKQATWTGCLAEEHDDFYKSEISRPYCPTTSSSVVERGTVDPQVAGSIPAWWTSGLLIAGPIPPQ